VDAPGQLLTDCTTPPVSQRAEGAWHYHPSDDGKTALAEHR
jgi:hypothetical protein